MTNSTLRKRFGLSGKHVSTVSKVIKDALAVETIKDANPNNRSRAQASYHPFWVS
ncbi:MAG TPA: hypothetical protein VIL77_13350 [Gaiellaceae bacterium]